MAARVPDGQDISTRAPRTEGDTAGMSARVKVMEFQPAPPARRATYPEIALALAHVISTRAPRTEGDLAGPTSP